ncbi:isoflavone reductase family protein [Fusarium oxysporum f. sp. phaseoli]
MKVAIIGATGQTGSVIVQALLESTASTFEVVALTRPSSLQKPGILELQEQGVKVVSTDLSGSESVLTEILVGTDVVISTIYGGSVMDEVPLINASKAAGVKRYLPCFFATVASPKGALLLRDMKEDVLNHIKKIHQPFTVIDVGWWYQVNLPKLPSGRIDYAAMETADGIAGDCNVPFALTDNQIYDLLEKLSGERIGRKYVPAEAIEASIAKIESTAPSPDSVEFITLAQHQYWYTCCIRGDNTSECATLLGYLNTQELYPHFERRGFKPYVQEVLDGNGGRGYEHLKDLPAASVDKKA